MSSFLAPLLSFLLLYKYWAIFLTVFAAAIAVPLPINSILLAAGAFASQGYFSFSLSFAVAMVANLLGDSLDYFLARRYGHAALRLLRIRVPAYLERLEEYVRDHPGPTIFFTRFAGAADAVANVFAGFVGVPFLVFLWWDFLGNGISIGGVLWAGYFFGDNWAAFSKFFSLSNWIIFAIIAVAAIGVALWYRDHRRRKHAAKH